MFTVVHTFFLIILIIKEHKVFLQAFTINLANSLDGFVSTQDLNMNYVVDWDNMNN